MVDNSKGTLVISLDFELMWGMIDVASPEGYGQSNVANVPFVIDEMLKLFLKYGVHASFATVGMMFYKDKKSLLNNLVDNQPTYIKTNISPYQNNYINNIQEQHKGLYFAPNLINMIANTDGMEVGTHTFCHYYCNEKGQTPEQFRTDIRCAKEIAKKNAIEISSIIFPRNQVSEAYLTICREEGICIYRGNADKFFNQKKGYISVTYQRICRLLDNYMNISGKTSYSANEVFAHGMYNIRASRFLRPYSKKLLCIEGLRLRRIKHEITKAAKNKEIYHLWWHPHNFGANTKENIKFLEQILKHYAYCNKLYGMKSMTMTEIALEYGK